MNNSSIVKKLILIVFIALILRFLINILLGEFNIFNYLNKKSKIDTLTKQLEKQTKVKEKLLYEVNILKNNSVVNLDILEKESTKKLNKIPQSYFIINE
ncbi:hypothetical protein HDR59_03865 [bacterium]|nr:hypothetical protein [bacterium]